MVEWHWARPRGMVGGTEGDKVQVKCENLVTGYLMSNVYVCECVCVCGWMDGWEGLVVPEPRTECVERERGEGGGAGRQHIAVVHPRSHHILSKPQSTDDVGCRGREVQAHTQQLVWHVWQSGSLGGRQSGCWVQ